MARTRLLASLWPLPRFPSKPLVFLADRLPAGRGFHRPPAVGSLAGIGSVTTEGHFVLVGIWLLFFFLSIGNKSVMLSVKIMCCPSRACALKSRGNMLHKLCSVPSLTKPPSPGRPDHRLELKSQVHTASKWALRFMAPLTMNSTACVGSGSMHSILEGSSFSCHDQVKHGM